MPKTDASFDLASYATVADRITLFYERFPAGRIDTQLMAHENGLITFKALVYRDSGDTVAAATGWASEREGDGDINTVACLENTETSAIGRALANLGFTASTKRPSREEMQKAHRARQRSVRGVESTRATRPVRNIFPADLQLQANAAHDLLDLLADAERRGFPAARAELLSARANALPPLPLARITALEAAVRRWLHRHDL